MSAAKKARSLFDDDEDEQTAEPIELKINEQYAARLKHNMARADLHRLQEKLGDKSLQIQAKAARHALAKLRKGGSVTVPRPEAGGAAGGEGVQKGLGDGNVGDEDESDDDDEDDEEEDRGLVRRKEEEAFLKVLAGVRRRDYSVVFSGPEGTDDTSDSSEEEEENEGADKPSKASKKVLLKDVLMTQAIQEAEGVDVYGSDEEGEKRGRARPPTYNEEQAQLLKEFREAAEADSRSEEEDDEEGGGFGSLRLKRKQEPSGPSADDNIPQLVETAFGADEGQLDEGDRFLKNYLLNKRWMVAESEDEGAADDYEEEEEQLEAEERFEAQYNFRFQEPGGASIVSYPRQVEGLRKPNERRKRAREARSARKAAEKVQQELEVRRLKNLMSAEIETKLRQIQEAAGRGTGDTAALLEALEMEDFDEADYDKFMQRMYGEDYYEEEDDFAPDADENKKESHAEDEEEEEKEEEKADEAEDLPAHVLEVVGPTAQAPTSFQVARERARQVSLQQEAEAGRKAARQRAEILRMMELYNSIEGEDRIGDLVCRFKYRQVPATDYGLGLDDILNLSEKELNQIVGLKKLATYRSDGGLVRPNFSKLKEFGVGRSHRKDPGGRAEHGERAAGHKRKWKQGRAYSRPEARAGALAPGDELEGGAGGGKNERKRKKGEKRKEDGTGPVALARADATAVADVIPSSGGGAGGGENGARKEKRKRRRGAGGQKAEAGSRGGPAEGGREKQQGNGELGSTPGGREKHGEGVQQDGGTKSVAGQEGERGEGKEGTGNRKRRPREGEAGGGGPGLKKAGDASKRGGAGSEGPSAEEVSAKRRLESYATPSLRGHLQGGGEKDKKKKRKTEEGKAGGVEGGVADRPQLSKAGRKNLRRSLKRAEKRKQQAGPG